MATENESSWPPKEVVGACLALVVAAAVACLADRPSAVLAGRPFARDVLVIVVIKALIVWQLLRRQNWLRIFIGASYLLNCLALVIVSTFKGIGAFAPLIALNSAVQLFAVTLLMLPASQEWFVPRHPVGNLSAFESVMLWIAGTLTVIAFVVGAMFAVFGRGAGVR